MHFGFLHFLHRRWGWRCGFSVLVFFELFNILQNSQEMIRNVITILYSLLATAPEIGKGKWELPIVCVR